MSGSLEPSTRTTAFVLCVLFVVSFLAVGRDLWTPDEPREAEISREMWLAPGVVPTLNGRPFIEKPPLYYWTVAGVFELVGRPSPWAARSVSAIASFLTLLLVYLWGRRDFSAAVGLLAAFGLATSAQFLVSSHWVLIDPLLMLFTTVGCWSAWELIRGGGGARRAGIFYAALVLALWTKGLIGPVLLGCGLFAFAVWKRSVQPIRSVYPIVGIAVVSAATGVFALLVYRSAGLDAVREWFWVNHVLRFTAPQSTGHDQPFYYYVSAIPIALMPWWVPAVDVFRRRRWAADGTLPNRDLRVYLACLTVGMALILSASSTKRGLYLLPMLPPLALLIAAHAWGWLQRWSAGASSWPLWTQLGLVALFAAAPTVLGLLYLMQVNSLAVGFLVALTVVVAATIVFARTQRYARALSALGLSGLAAVLGWLVVVVHMASPVKDMSEFVDWLDQQVPPGQAIHGLGDIDETFDGIVPFVTGRTVIQLAREDVSRVAPAFVVVQDKNGGETAPDLSAAYERIAERKFGPGRYVAVWRRDSSDGSSVVISQE